MRFVTDRETGINTDRSITRKVVFAQLAAVLIITAGVRLWFDGRAALSVLLGGLICATGTLVLAGIMFSREGMTPAQMVLAFYLGEAAKIILTVAGFIAAFLLVDLNAAAFILAYITILSFNWIALLVANK